MPGMVQNIVQHRKNVETNSSRLKEEIRIIDKASMNKSIREIRGQR